MAIVASELHWVPETLYNASVSCVVVNFKKYRRELPQLPRNVQFDVYYKVKLPKYQQGNVYCVEYAAQCMILLLVLVIL